MTYVRRVDSPLGGMTMLSDGERLCGLWFDGQAHAPAADPAWVEAELGVFARTSDWLEIYFGGGIPDFTPPLLLRGTAFREAVWAALLKIPYGKTASYRDVAAALAAEGAFPRASARAVGGAIGRNPVALIVPCHRVIGSDGGLTGYAGGLARKAKLLRLEAGGG